MDRNNVIGLVLIFAILFVWMRINAPTAEQLAEQERLQDSIRLAAEMSADSLARMPGNSAGLPATSDSIVVVAQDSIRNAQLAGIYGAFADAATGDEQLTTLENEEVKVVFTNKGGIIKEVELKKYFKILTDEEGVETKIPLKLLEDEKNKFEYFLPLANVPGGSVKTSDLYFSPTLSGNTISFRARAAGGKYFEQRYSLNPSGYGMEYEVDFSGLNGLIDNQARDIKLNWVNYLDKLEKNTQYERYYSSVYYKEAEEDPDYCSCRDDDLEDLEGKVKWVSHSNQFFNSGLIAENYFSSAVVETQMLEEEADDLKLLRSEIRIPVEQQGFKMTLYSGPNEFKRLASYGSDFEDLIPFGWSVFGTINRWVIRPVFNFLWGFIGNAGLVILMLTLIVKLVLYPLTYKMLYSQSKMGALKPQLAKLKEKHSDNPTEMQKETMKVYSEFGVSPFGGCMPMVLQMPIWFALYRFFPASIEFRQANFLWATDLSSYDVFVQLPFEIPFYGAHVSLFTILWAFTTVIYTYYNSKHMDMNINPMMKYMQYGMPVMFLFFFNNFAAGLTCYLLFSNLMNITQTIVTKNYIINQDKIKMELEDYRKKPKKKGGFQERLQKAMAEQQRLQQDRDTQSKKSPKKKK